MKTKWNLWALLILFSAIAANASAADYSFGINLGNLVKGKSPVETNKSSGANKSSEAADDKGSADQLAGEGGHGMCIAADLPEGTVPLRFYSGFGSDRLNKNELEYLARAVDPSFPKLTQAHLRELVESELSAKGERIPSNVFKAEKMYESFSKVIFARVETLKKAKQYCLDFANPHDVTFYHYDLQRKAMPIGAEYFRNGGIYNIFYPDGGYYPNGDTKNTVEGSVCLSLQHGEPIFDQVNRGGGILFKLSDEETERIEDGISWGQGRAFFKVTSVSHKPLSVYHRGADGINCEKYVSLITETTLFEVPYNSKGEQYILRMTKF